MNDKPAPSALLSPAQAELFREKHFALVTTLMPDGSPQTTPVWVDTDGEHIFFNTARGRIKTDNLERDPRVSVAVVDPDKPYERWVAVRGRTELVEEGAVDQIHRLAQKYIGRDYPWLQSDETRVTVKVHPEKIAGGI
jgi:PPOX class probable F420-dependent enzyme